MTIDEFKTSVEKLEDRARAELEAASSLTSLSEIHHKYLSRGRGELTSLEKLIPSFPADQRKAAGESVNGAKNQLWLWETARREKLQSTESTERHALDLTMPARRTWRGAKHPVTLVIEEIEGIFRELGFTIATGPEAETDWYNFGALNFPSDHPAMDMHDTLYLGDGTLLRTHTSPVQVRTLQRYEPPIRILAPGNVYRRDFFDASHAPVFAQIEGMAVDDDITFSDLEATLAHFADRFFGATRTRFRPSYFPFTEPSAEMDVECQICHGTGCPTCKGTGWSEILGCGLMHPAVLETAGLDSERYSGWAFGMGPGRIAMQRYGIPDIRLLYDSDVRVLQQFER